MNEQKQHIVLAKPLLAIAITSNIIFVAVALLGIIIEAVSGGQEWRKIVHYAVFGLPFTMGLLVLLGRNSNWFNNYFSGQRGRRLTYLLIGVYLSIRLAERAITRT